MNTPRPRAFSIIELLVVISIIVLLIGLLLPAMSAFRMYSRTAKCQNNVREIAGALGLYIKDNRNVYPMLPSGNSLAVVGDTGTSSTYGGTTPRNDRALADFVGRSVEVARSPLDRGSNPGSTDEPMWKTFGSSYWYPTGANSDTAFAVDNGAWVVGGRRHTEITMPSRKLLIADAMMAFSVFSAANDINRWRRVGDPMPINVGFADGSAADMPRKTSNDLAGSVQGVNQNPAQYPYY